MKSHAHTYHNSTRALGIVMYFWGQSVTYADVQFLGRIQCNWWREMEVEYPRISIKQPYKHASYISTSQTKTKSRWHRYLLETRSRSQSVHQCNCLIHPYSFSTHIVFLIYFTSSTLSSFDLSKPRRTFKTKTIFQNQDRDQFNPEKTFEFQVHWALTRIYKSPNLFILQHSRKTHSGHAHDINPIKNQINYWQRL